MTSSTHRTAIGAGILAAGLLLAGCGNNTDHSNMPGMGSSSSEPDASHDMGSMDGMAMPHGDGLSVSVDGYTLELKSGPTTESATPVNFVITKDGKPVTGFRTEQTKKLHFYVIRNDLTGFEHLHPTMDADGTWSVTVPPVQPGEHRIYTQIEPVGAAEPIVLSTPVTVDGTVESSPLPPATRSASVDGYTITLDGRATNGGKLRMSFARDGKPVTELEPYLETYAHVTAFRKGDMAFSHLHPTDTVTDAGGGPDLSFMVEVPRPGIYRLFLQFRVGGSLHTAAITSLIS